MKKLILSCFLTFGLQTFIFSQNIPNSVTRDSAILYEKLYLHIDRELYQPGDDIWFKSYLVSGINHQPIPGNKNVYAQLLTEDGEIVRQLLMLSINGVSINDFHLPDTLPKGSYTIRGYTKYLQNFGEKSLFHQKIAVASSTDLPDFEDEAEKPENIDVSFLPEGGSFVLNAANQIAFKAIDENGRGVPVTGKVLDETGAEVAKFESRYKGMGTFMLMPKEGKRYVAKINGYPEFTYHFEEPQFDGISLHYQPRGNQLYFILNRNIKSNSTKQLLLVASHKGRELFREKIEMTGFQHPLTVYKGSFPPGISKVTVFDEQQNVMAERLIFVQNPNDEGLKIIPNKASYETRDSVELEIESLLENDSIATGISLAVVNEDYFSEGGRSQSMQSYLLLDSELKGPLESPADYFFDSEEITSDEKLDLVMQVHGWRRYYWDELNNYFGKPLPGWEDIGLTISGRVKRLFGDKWVENGTVQLGPFSNQFIILKDTTDELGRFRFNRVYVKDSAQMMLNATNKKGRKNVEIIYEPAPVFDSIISVTEINKTVNSVQIPHKFYRSSYYRYMAEREFALEEGTILLGDVDIVRKKKEEDSHFRMYGEPDISLELTDDDWTYANIFDYLSSKAVAGVIVTGETISIRGGGTPLFVIDGLPQIMETEADYERIVNFPIQDIEKIEILKGAFYSAMFGSQGGDGVISILTRTGEGAFGGEFRRIIHNRATPLIRGFKQAREFYSPTYPLPADSLDKPDQRPTLYWNPFVIPQNGKAKVKFFASDMVSRYRVIAEGISQKGKLCFGTAEFDVVVPEN